MKHIIKTLIYSFVFCIMFIFNVNFNTYANEVDLNDLFREDATYDSSEEMPNAEELVGDVIYVPEIEDEEETIINNENNTIKEETNIEETPTTNEEENVENEDNQENETKEKSDKNTVMTLSFIGVALFIILGIIIVVFCTKQKDKEE